MTMLTRLRPTADNKNVPSYYEAQFLRDSARPPFIRALTVDYARIMYPSPTVVKNGLLWFLPSHRHQLYISHGKDVCATLLRVALKPMSLRVIKELCVVICLRWILYRRFIIWLLVLQIFANEIQAVVHIQDPTYFIKFVGQGTGRRDVRLGGSAGLSDEGTPRLPDALWELAGKCWIWS